VNQAHMVSLVRGKEVGRVVGANCLKFLQETSTKVDPESLTEDYHQFLEQAAVDSLGVDTAGYLNLGKSRNDQVATAIRMHLKHVLLRVISNALDLQNSMLLIARAQGRYILPGFTHLQHAQPITLAHHMFAYFDSLQRDVERLFQLYVRADASPMGGAALAGTSVRVGRVEVAGLLGFGRLVDNAMDAVSSRDVEMEALACFAIMMTSLSRVSEELVLWSSKEFSFIEIPDEYAATSSIMPQKKNPIVAEVARAKSGSVLGALTACIAIVKSLPYSYNLDLQEVTPHLWRAADDVSSSISLLSGMMRGLKFNPGAMVRSMEGDFSTATSLANYLVRVHGVSFRQAHSIVGGLVRSAVTGGKSLAEVAERQLGGMIEKETGKTVSISKREINSVLSVQASLAQIATKGGSNPKFTTDGLRSRTKSMVDARARLTSMRTFLEESERRLARTVRSITKEVKS